MHVQQQQYALAQVLGHMMGDMSGIPRQKRYVEGGKSMAALEKSTHDIVLTTAMPTPLLLQIIHSKVTAMC